MCVCVWVLACVCHRVCSCVCVCLCACVSVCFACFATSAAFRSLSGFLFFGFVFGLASSCRIRLSLLPFPLHPPLPLPTPALCPFLLPLSLCCAISREVTAHQSKRSLPASELCVRGATISSPSPFPLLPLYCCLTCAINTLYEHLKLFHFAATFEYKT